VHSGARAIIVDAELAQVVTTVLQDCPDLHTIVTVADGDASAARDALEYEAFLETGTDDARPPQLTDADERISINYTSGTTGNPRVWFARTAAPTSTR
jgi:acyl-coenzyme A synthetase/AMP-(fatty) acid ligase